MKTVQLLIIITLLLFTSVSIVADESTTKNEYAANGLKLGLDISYNHCYNGDSFEKINSISWSRFKGEAFSFGIDLEQYLTKLYSMPVSIGLNLSYMSVPLLSERLSECVCGLDIEYEGEEIKPVIDQNTRFEVNVFSLGFYIKTSPIRNISLFAGIDTWYISDNEVFSEMTIIEPAGATFIENENSDELGYKFENEHRTVSRVQNDERLNEFTFGIAAGIEYDINLNSVHIQPYVSYRIGLNNIVDDEGWKINYLSGGIKVMFRL